MAKQVDRADIRRTAAMWAGTIYQQVSRLEDAVDRLQGAAADEQFRAAFEHAGRPAAWARVADAASRTVTERELLAVAADKYFLLLAASQLIKCIRLLPDDDLPSFRDRTLLRHLRNLEEHWEDPSGPSASWLRKLIPDVEPGRIRYSKKDIWLEGVSLTEILQWVEDVDRKVRHKLEETT